MYPDGIFASILIWILKALKIKSTLPSDFWIKNISAVYGDSMTVDKRPNDLAWTPMDFVRSNSSDHHRKSTERDFMLSNYGRNLRVGYKPNCLALKPFSYSNYTRSKKIRKGFLFMRRAQKKKNPIYTSEDHTRALLQKQQGYGNFKKYSRNTRFLLNFLSKVFFLEDLY